jgi:hypothetical protein
MITNMKVLEHETSQKRRKESPPVFTGKAKVHEVDAVCLFWRQAQQQILRLHIIVNIILAVDELKGVQDLRWNSWTSI